MATIKPIEKISPALTVVITAHAEGILLHKTLVSVRRAIELLERNGVATEIIIHADNPTPATKAYLHAHQKDLSDVHVYINDFGDLGSARNFAVGKATGKYVTFIDADDLMSGNWLLKAYDFLELNTEGAYVAHSELTVEFGGMDAIVLKHGELGKTADTLLSVYANRWNSIIMAPRQLLLEERYTQNNAGFGYEDWHLNCRLIARGVHNVLIPQTAIFVRRKSHGSEWLRQRQSSAVLPKNTLFTFSAIRSLHDLPVDFKLTTSTKTIKQTVGEFVKRLPAGETIARGVYRAAKEAQRFGRVASSKPLPAWLQDEWQAMHDIDRRIFLSDSLRSHPPYYDSLTKEHFQAGAAYKSMVDHTHSDSYDYILFVPWLQKGGADAFAINFLNSLKKQRPRWKIAVLATLDSASPWTTKLTDGIDFIPFGTITAGMSMEVRQRVLEQFIENSSATYFHIINSEFAYDFVSSHGLYLQASEKNVVATSFSQSVDSSGRVFGYSHTHVPEVYDLVHLITTDNQAVVDMWKDEYGFDTAKLLIQRPSVTIPHSDRLSRSATPDDLRVLWAARLSPEKQPELVAKIAKLLEHKSIQIDMYGTVDEGFDTTFLRSLPLNVSYKGPFDGFYSLPLDHYDAYLYTSIFDGMPNAVLEAAAVGLPIVSSAVGGVPELITNRVDGMLANRLTKPEEYAEALTFLLDHPSERHAYGTSLLEKLNQEYSADAYEKQTRNFLDRLGA